MSIKIALAGNPNCGKTTLFNELTGSNQYVGNWPGVTVEKKEGKLKNHDDIIIEDLPGIYSLSPYTTEEIVTRDYLVNNKPDCILNIIDGTNIERNLYLTTQLKEIGIPMVVAINMIDIVEKNGDKIDLDTLSRSLHCPVLGISALKNIGINEVINATINEAKHEKADEDSIPHVFTGSVEHSIAHIEETIQDKVPEKYIRWYAIKIFERDKKAYNTLNLSKDDEAHLENHIKECEEELDDKSVCIITKDRYSFISRLLDRSIIKSTRKDMLTTTDKIDRFLTHRFFAIPLFAVIMYLIYTVAMGSIGTSLTEWMQNVLIGDVISNNLRAFLIDIGASEAIQSLLIDGIINGVGTVISFVPQMLLLFLFISILEDSGYMARVAFIFDRLFRKFGLSGKSFIPMIIGTGCGVPAIMSCRTIEERDKRLTIMLCTFIPCTAKMEVILLISAVFFDGNSLVATSMYFIGIIVVIVSGIILKKLKYFSKDPVPFVIELPSYHIPSIKSIYFLVKDRIKDFIVKAGTVIFIACIISWFLMNFDFRLQMVSIDKSILKYIGEKIAFFFAPLGFGNWQCSVASISATIAKEQAAATLSMIASQETNVSLSFEQSIQALFNNNPIKALSFAIFNVFNAPCMVAILTAFKEQNSKKWGFITLAFQLFVGYILALFTYQIGSIIF